MSTYNGVSFLRYPGGKQRMLDFLIPRLPSAGSGWSRLVEPFAGAAAVFFALGPERAILADMNGELIDLYRGIRSYPRQVWDTYRQFPSTKKAYYRIRRWRHEDLDPVTRAARTLYLNRTCFKGMWRHNAAGQFNVGYGGQDRRWAISRDTLEFASGRLAAACLECSDFERVIDACRGTDFMFVDPPYRPGERDMLHDHYCFGRFTFDDHLRLAAALGRASDKDVRWAMTTSAHKDIVGLFEGCRIMPMPIGTGGNIGELAGQPGEVLVCNYQEAAA